MAALITEFMLDGATGEPPPQAEVDTSCGVAVEAALPASTPQQHLVLLHLLQPQTPSYAAGPAPS